MEASLQCLGKRRIGFVAAGLSARSGSGWFALFRSLSRTKCDDLPVRVKEPVVGLMRWRVRRYVASAQTMETDHPNNGQGAHIAGSARSWGHLPGLGRCRYERIVATARLICQMTAELAPSAGSRALPEGVEAIGGRCYALPDRRPPCGRVLATPQRFLTQPRGVP